MTDKVLIGNAVKWSVEFVDEDGDAVDPTVVTFTLRAPDETETEYVYGADNEVVRDSEGAYHIWLNPGIDPDQLGEYTGFFRGAGNVTARACGKVEMVDECL